VNLRALLDAVSWQVRGPFAVSPIREIGFAARDLFQLGEVRARKELAREIERCSLTIDETSGFIRLEADPMFERVAVTGMAIANANAGTNMGGKEFFRARFSTDDEIEIVLRAALDRRILSAVARYLGTVPVIFEADYYCSVPHGPPWSKSQLWHCDDDGSRIVKLFVYCDRVTSANGPFELVDAATSDRVRRAVGYRYAGRRYRVSDAVMDAQVPPTRQLGIEGAACSGFLIDTSRCFHRGSRIVTKGQTRIAAIVTYVRPNGRRMPLRLADAPPPLMRFASRFTDRFERAALGEPVA
jgi:hypothetical protein